MGEMMHHRSTSEKPGGAEHIELLLLDVDGVLTDGRIVYGENGVETKSFNVKDGLGLRLLMGAGINAGIVTGRSSKALIRRCEDLGIVHVYDGVKDKAGVLDTICKQFDVDPASIAFMGDDLPDIPLMARVGLDVAVADAHEAVRTMADVVTAARGGAGAVREICETILKSKGLWEEISNRFTEPADNE